MQTYQGYLNIFTDESKQNSGETGAAYCIPEKGRQCEIKMEIHHTVFTAEQIATKSALQHAIVINCINRDTAIFTDSLSAVKIIQTQCISAFTNMQIQSHIIDLATKLMKEQQISTTLVWVPSHIGIAGNEQVDQLAKHSTTKPVPDLRLPMNLQEIKQDHENQIDKEWQEKYDISSTAKHYKSVEPKD